MDGACLLDRLEHFFDIAGHLGVRESNDPIPLPFKKASPLGIVLGLFRLCVGVAVDFDADARAGAVEVDDETTQEDLLPTDVDADLVVAQVAPEMLLSCRRTSTQIARASKVPS